MYKCETCGTDLQENPKLKEESAETKKLYINNTNILLKLKAEIELIKSNASKLITEYIKDNSKLQQENQSLKQLQKRIEERIEDGIQDQENIWKITKTRSIKLDYLVSELQQLLKEDKK